MPHTLQIAENLSLPLDLVTSTQAIIAQKRSGKSYTASVEAEEMLERNQQIAVLDPTSAWYGLRSSADGKGPGYPIVVFGGEHADAPLDCRSGKAMAKAVVERGFSAIFDIGGWVTEEQIQFVFEFTSELLRINRTALHLFIDEADTFAPQQLTGKLDKQCLGATSRLVKQGGIKGIGITLITQRSADLNKKLLSQIDRLTLLRMRHPPDMKPAAEWVSANIGPDYAREVTEALPRLAVGEAFICDGPRGKGQRAKIRQRRTFNSGATPKPGEERAEPKVLAPIDVQKLGEQIAEAVREEQANSPEVLKRRIADLEDALQERPAGGLSKERETMLVEQIQQMEVDLQSLREANEELGGSVERLRARQERVASLAREMIGLFDAEMPAVQERHPIPREPLSTIPPSPVAAIRPYVPEHPAESNGDRAALSLDGPSTRILKALAELWALRISPAPREQVALFAGYTNLGSKGLVNSLGSLRSGGLIDYPESGKVLLTEDGRKGAPPVTRVQSERELHERLLGLLDGPGQRILRVLLHERRSAITRMALAAASGYSNLGSKGFVNTLGRLRSLGLIDYPSQGQVRATDLMFFSGAR